MKPEKIIQFLILFIINFLLVTVINYAFLKWLANKPDTTFTSVIGRSALMAVVVTILFTAFSKKKTD